MSPLSQPKSLVLIRHATAGWETGQADFDRQLLPRGEEEARALGRWLCACGCQPAVACASSAPRAQQTLRLVADAWPPSSFPEPREIFALYEASAGQLLDFLHQLSDDAPSALVVAHNPSITHLGALLIGEPLWELPPAGALWLECSVETWRQLAPGGAVLHRRWQP